MKKLLLALLVIGIAIGGYFGWQYYNYIYKGNVKVTDNENLYIPTGATFPQVAEILYDQGFLLDTSSFNWVAKKKNYPAHVNPGRYILKDGMSNEELVNLLRSGEQSPVKVTFNNVRLLSELAGKVGKQIEADSTNLYLVFSNPEVHKKYGFDGHTFRTLFIPNTYEFYWDTNPEEFVAKMASEYKSFWNSNRKTKAQKIGLSQSEVTTLASIVNAETNLASDYSKVAGVYVNRINRGMKLQSDPTLVWALGNFNVRRVLNRDKLIESPYNTYLNKGLPPGPINLPPVTCIDAVLNYERHEYIFFCAAPDYSGKSVFAKNLRQHNINAAKYRAFLNKEGIYR